MSTITITITMPDGADIKVGRGEARGEAKPFVERDPGPYPGGHCPEHGEEWVLQKAGVSQKTGNRYNAFWKCPTKWCNERPPKPGEQYVDDISAGDDLPF